MNEEPARDWLIDAAQEAAKRARILLEMAAEADSLTYGVMEDMSSQIVMLEQAGQRARRALGDWRLQAHREALL